MTASQGLAPVEAALEVSQAAVEGAPPRKLLSMIARHTRSLLGASLVAVCTPAEDGSGHPVRTSVGLGSRRLRGWTVPALDRTVAAVLGARRPRAVALDATSWPAFLPASLAGALGWSLLAPMVARGRGVGLLLVGRPPEKPGFRDRDLTLAQLFATQAATALAHHASRASMLRLNLIEDRQRIATDLHDGVAQRLFGIGLSLEAELSQAEGAILRQRLEAAIHGIDHVIRGLRASVEDLDPSLHPGRQVHLALRTIAADAVDRSHLAIEVDVDEDLAARLGRLVDPVLDLAREMVADVMRFPSVRGCRVSLLQAAESAVLELVDDGRGRGGERRRSRLERRAAAVGAGVEVDAVPEQGTTVRVTLGLE
jgi:signal transduction histidine kinase